MKIKFYLLESDQELRKCYLAIRNNLIGQLH